MCRFSASRTMQWSIPERYLHFDSLVKLPPCCEINWKRVSICCCRTRTETNMTCPSFRSALFSFQTETDPSRWKQGPRLRPGWSVSVEVLTGIQPRLSLQLESLEGRRARYRLSCLSAAAVITRGSRLWLTARHVLVWLCLCMGNRSVATAPGEDPETCYFLPVCRAPL